MRRTALEKVHAKSVQTAIISISNQLCGLVSGFRNGLPESKSDIDELIKNCGSNLNLLMEKLILEPSLVVKMQEKPVCVLLDALDECAESSVLIQKYSILLEEASKLVVVGYCFKT